MPSLLVEFEIQSHDLTAIVFLSRISRYRILWKIVESFPLQEVDWFATVGLNNLKKNQLTTGL